MGKTHFGEFWSQLVILALGVYFFGPWLVLGLGAGAWVLIWLSGKL